MNFRNEEKYKSFERIGEALDLFLDWCRETKTSLDNPLKVLIQVKEVSRIKSQKQVILPLACTLIEMSHTYINVHVYWGPLITAVRA